MASMRTLNRLGRTASIGVVLAVIVLILHLMGIL